MANFQHIDQSGGTGDSYGVLSGAIDGVNKVFAVSQGLYLTSTLSVELNGQLQTQGTSEDWTETNTAAGTFTFTVAPITGDEITARYNIVEIPAGGLGQKLSLLTEDTAPANSDYFLKWNSAQNEFKRTTIDNMQTNFSASNQVVINSIADFPEPTSVTDLPITFDGTTNEVQHAYGAGVFADGQAIEFVGASLPTDISLRTIYFAYNNDTDSFLLSSTPPSIAVTPVTFSNGSGSARVAGEIQLENKWYIINQDIFTPYDFNVNGASVRITGISSVYGSTLIYMGAGTLFKGTPINVDLFQCAVAGTVAGTLFDITDLPGTDNSFILVRMVNIVGFGDLGTIDGALFSGNTIAFLDIGQGLKFIDNTTIGMNTCTFSGWKNQVGCEMIKISGTIGGGSLSNMDFYPQTNESIFNLEQDLTVLGVIKFIGLAPSVAYGGSLFATDSLDQTNKQLSFVACQPIPDSTAKLKMSIASNTLETAIIAANTPTEINAIWGDGSIEERFVFQDEITFDNTTDTLTTTYNHNMSNEDIITLNTITGTLPTGLAVETTYYVRDITATTFKVETSIGGGAVDFTTDGTGTNFYRHVTGASGCGLAVYTGLEDVSVGVSGGVDLSGLTGGGVDTRTYVMKYAEDGTITKYEDGRIINVATGWSGASTVNSIVDLKTNEGVKIYIGNLTDTTNLVVTNGNITINKV